MRMDLFFSQVPKDVYPQHHSLSFGSSFYQLILLKTNVSSLTYPQKLLTYNDSKTNCIAACIRRNNKEPCDSINVVCELMLMKLVNGCKEHVMNDN